MTKMTELIAESMLQEVDSYKAYAMIVAAFGQLTNIQHPDSGVCCVKKDEHGAPYCCYSLVDGTYRLSFTGSEIDALGRGGVSFHRAGVMPAWETKGDDRIWYANVTNPELMRESLKDGLLANTIECASHPTRPVIEDGKVTKVVIVNDCIAEYASDMLRKNAGDFLWLWQQSVNLFGVKPYYITGRFDSEKYTVL